MNACDANDGVKDGVLENPKGCKFDPAVLACKGTPDNSCLTPAEITTVRAIYASPANPKSKREIAGLAPGSEANWTDLGWSGPARSTGLELMRFVANDPQWTIAQFNFDADVVRAEDKAGIMNALDTNLKPFFDRGGRLISYHGWNDPQISPLNATQYYDRVVKAMGGANRVSSSYRLFMVPGMAHCGGGIGPDRHDAVTAVINWVEKGQAPSSMTASRVVNNEVVRTRPLCAYPQVARYSGTGSIDDAANFKCVAP
jgi:feruloyl esterase